MRGELRTTNSFGGRREGTSERASGGDSFRHERGPSFPFSIVCPSALSICGGGSRTESMENGSLPRRFQYQISIHNFWQRFNTSSATFLDVTLPLSPSSCANFAACGRHAVSSFRYAHHGLLTRRITRLPPEHGSPSLSSLRSIGEEAHISMGFLLRPRPPPQPASLSFSVARSCLPVSL